MACSVFSSKEQFTAVGKHYSTRLGNGKLSEFSCANQSMRFPYAQSFELKARDLAMGS